MDYRVAEVELRLDGKINYNKSRTDKCNSSSKECSGKILCLTCPHWPSYYLVVCEYHASTYPSWTEYGKDNEQAD